MSRLVRSDFGFPKLSLGIFLPILRSVLNISPASITTLFRMLLRRLFVLFSSTSLEKA
jgi:hypothetical protein